MPTAEQLLAELESNFSDLTETSSYFKGLLYGPSGVGKTKLAFEIAQLVTPDNKMIYYVDSAEGWSVLNNHPELKRRAKRARWAGVGQSEVLAEAIEAGVGSFANVGCLIFDEYSSMQDADLDVVVKQKAAQDKSKSPDEAKFPDMGATTTRMRRLTDKLVPLDIHIIFIAHERIDEGNRGHKKTSAAFMPKFGSKVKERMHLVAHCVADEVIVEGGTDYRRYLEVQPTNTVDAKSRIGTFKTPQVDIVNVPSGIAEWLNSGGTLKSVAESEKLVVESPELDSSPSSDESTTDDIDDMGVDI